MLRWLLPVVASVFLAGCSTASKPLDEVLPTNVNGWARSSVSPMEAASAPELIRQLGLKRAASATYSGPASITVRVFEMNVPTSAFELIQKWRQQDGLAVYTGPYFLAAMPGSPPETAKLLEALRKELK